MDACGASSLQFSETTIHGSCPNKYQLVRKWTATDVCGNTSTAGYIIVVNDETVPDVTAPTTVDLECSGDISLHAAATNITEYLALSGASGE